jgi:hypothetical protein
VSKTIVNDGRRGTIVCRSAGNGAWIKLRRQLRQRGSNDPFRVGWYACDVCRWSCFARHIGAAVAAHIRLRSAFCGGGL